MPLPFCFATFDSIHTARLFHWFIFAAVGFRRFFERLPHAMMPRLRQFVFLRGVDAMLDASAASLFF